MFFQIIIRIPFFIISLLIPPTVDTDISKYESCRQELNNAADFMPALDSLGAFEEVRFGYQETREFIFLPKTMSLTVKYSEAEYATVKDQMLDRYEFIATPITDTDGDVLVDDSFTHQGYTFQSLPMSDYTYRACKYFGLLGVNDEQCSIAWLYYDDPDRDFIAEPDENLDEKMRTLIDDEFHWKPITE